MTFTNPVTCSETKQDQATNSNRSPLEFYEADEQAGREAFRQGFRTDKCPHQPSQMTKADADATVKRMKDRIQYHKDWPNGYGKPGGKIQ